MVRTLKPNNIPYAKAKLIIDKNSPYTDLIVVNQRWEFIKENKKVRKQEKKK